MNLPDPYIARCDICNREFGPGEDIFYECPDGLPGHDWLECADCHEPPASDPRPDPLTHPEHWTE